MLETRYPVRLTREQKQKLKAVAAADGRLPASWLRWQIELRYRDMVNQQRQREQRAKEHAQ